MLKSHWKLALYAIVLMTAYNFFSHGTQDLYPTFLQSSMAWITPRVTIAIIYNIGAILGGLIFGSLSQLFGRRRAIIGRRSARGAGDFSLGILPHARAAGAGRVPDAVLASRAPGAWFRPISTNFRRRARAAHSPARSINWAICIASINAVLQAVSPTEPAAITHRAGQRGGRRGAGDRAVMKLGPEAQDVEMTSRP